MARPSARTGILLGSLFLAGSLSFSQLERPTETPRPLVGSAEKLLVLYERWRAATGGVGAPLRLSLGWSRGRSEHFTRARGEATFDLVARTLTVSLEGIEVEDAGGGPSLDVWLEPVGTAGPVLLGALPLVDGAGGFQRSIDDALAALELDEVVVARPDGQRLLFGAPDLFQRMAALELTRARPLRGEEIGGVPLGAPAAGAVGSWRTSALDGLVARGERLFFQETFAGNGRTCGTCHPAENNFTLDPDFIATLPPDDPLFVAEYVPALDAQRNGGLVFESPEHLRRFGLIVENVDGSDDLAHGFVLRAVQPTLGLAATIEPDRRFTQPLGNLTGWGGDGAPGRGTLREFALGAVKQHFPRTLARRAGSDFRLPDSTELASLEGFQLSLGRTEDPDLGALDFHSPRVQRGLQAFLFQGICNACHTNGGGNSVFLDSHSAVFVNTGVEALEHHVPGDTLLARPADGGFGTRPDGSFGGLEPLATGGFGNGRFNPPSLVEFADTLPAFHGHLTARPGSGLANTVEGAIAFYATQEFIDEGFGDLQLTPSNIADLGSFLRALNALENVRTVDEYASRALDEYRARPLTETERRVQRLLQLAELENEDAVRVLEEVNLHTSVQELLREVDARLQRARIAPPAERVAELRTIRTRLAQARSGIAD